MIGHDFDISDAGGGVTAVNPVVIASLQRGGVPVRSLSHFLIREASRKKRRCAGMQSFIRSRIA
jgi:hypothetical protein